MAARRLSVFCCIAAALNPFFTLASVAEHAREHRDTPVVHHGHSHEDGHVPHRDHDPMGNPIPVALQSGDWIARPSSDQGDQLRVVFWIGACLIAEELTLDSQTPQARFDANCRPPPACPRAGDLPLLI